MCYPSIVSSIVSSLDREPRREPGTPLELLPYQSQRLARLTSKFKAELNIRHTLEPFVPNLFCFHSEMSLWEFTSRNGVRSMEGLEDIMADSNWFCFFKIKAFFFST